MDKIFNLKAGVKWEGMDNSFSEDRSRWISVAEYIKDICGGVPTITSTRGDKHSINSLHYRGQAVDLRINDWREHVFGEIHCKTIAWLLGARWVVVLETNHLHIQIGTENIRNPSHIIKCGKGNFLQ